MSIYAKLIMIFALTGLVACQSKKEIIVETPSGDQAVFSVSIAKTPEEQQKGLMFVEEMPADEGMLFVYSEPVKAKFWMKNTLIPLDMLFFDKNNRLVYIEHSAPPQSLAPRGPNSPVCNVLELNGGTAKNLGIKPGSKLIENFLEECLHSPHK